MTNRLSKDHIQRLFNAAYISSLCGEAVNADVANKNIHLPIYDPRVRQ